MDLENNVQTGETSETSNKRKSFLEKLGLVEPIEQEGLEQALPNSIKENVPNSPESIQSLFNDAPGADKPDADLTYKSTSEPVAAFNSSYRADTDYQNAVSSQKNIQMLTVSEVYTLFNLKPATDKGTVYLVESLMQALPVNLPFEVKKDSLQKLLVASGIDGFDLVSDGKERIQMLERYLESFTKDLEDVIAYNESQVLELKEKIKQYSQVIAEKTKMISEQRSLVRFEMQRITDLLDSLDKGK